MGGDVRDQIPIIAQDSIVPSHFSTRYIITDPEVGNQALYPRIAGYSGAVRRDTMRESFYRLEVLVPH